MRGTANRPSHDSYLFCSTVFSVILGTAVFLIRVLLAWGGICGTSQQAKVNVRDLMFCNIFEIFSGEPSTTRLVAALHRNDRFAV